MPRSTGGGQGAGRSNQGGNNSGNQTGRSDKGMGSTMDKTKKDVARKGTESTQERTRSTGGSNRGRGSE
jgi:hypothetical protein